LPKGGRRHADGKQEEPHDDRPFPAHPISEMAGSEVRGFARTGARTATVADVREIATESVETPVERNLLLRPSELISEGINEFEQPGVQRIWQVISR